MPLKSDNREYAFKYCYLLLFQISLRTRVRGESKWRTFSGFGPTSFSYKARAASHPRKSGSNPCNHVYKIINNIIRKISLEKSGIRQDRYRILTFSILIISVEIKEIMGYLPLLPIVFDTPLSPFLRCFHIFVALPPFLIFLNTKNLLFAQVIKSTWNFGA